MSGADHLTAVEFWPGKVGLVDLVELARSPVAVKGTVCAQPLRFLELYLDHGERRKTQAGPSIEDLLPRCDGRFMPLGARVAQPPFVWRDATPELLALSFTYNANGLWRLLDGLRRQGRVPADVGGLFDQACQTLAGVYRADDHFLIRNINNNINMYLITRVIEHVVGKERFDSEAQELDATRRALDLALRLAKDRRSLPTREKMALAVGSGVSFVEGRMEDGDLPRRALDAVQAATYRFAGVELAIDHRDRLLAMVDDRSQRRRGFTLAVVVDDTTETVDDLLWIQDLVERYGGFRVVLIVNTAQVSINFSAHLLPQLWRSPLFTTLASRLGDQVLVETVSYPLLAVQENCLPERARRAIDRADAVYIKGANFFEACQIEPAETFYAFVVFGQMSRYVTGLPDYAGVFAEVPPGSMGYRYSSDRGQHRTLLDVVATDVSGRKPGGPHED